MANIVWKTKTELATGQLRIQRNRKLAETDHFALSDQTLSADMKTYRQKLRDITDTQTPIMNENNDDGPTGITWPTKPE